VCFGGGGGGETGNVKPVFPKKMGAREDKSRDGNKKQTRHQTKNTLGRKKSNVQKAGGGRNKKRNGNENHNTSHNRRVSKKNKSAYSQVQGELGTQRLCGNLPAEKKQQEVLGEKKNWKIWTGTHLKALERKGGKTDDPNSTAPSTATGLREKNKENHANALRPNVGKKKLGWGG